MIDLVQCCHELGVAYAADGYARAQATPGVVLVDASPGFSNLLSALVVAREEHISLVVISGDVPTSLQRIGAFQGASFDHSVSAPITKLTIEIQASKNAAHRAL